MTTVLISPAADDDLVATWLYIANDDEDAAAVLLDRLARLFQQLAGNVHMGRARPEFEMPELRSFPHGAYVVFYRPVQRGVEIVRVFHSARDLTAAYFENRGTEEF